MSMTLGSPEVSIRVDSRLQRGSLTKLQTKPRLLDQNSSPERDGSEFAETARLRGRSRSPPVSPRCSVLPHHSSYLCISNKYSVVIPLDVSPDWSNLILVTCFVGELRQLFFFGISPVVTASNFCFILEASHGLRLQIKQRLSSFVLPEIFCGVLFPRNPLFSIRHWSSCYTWVFFRCSPNEFTLQVLLSICKSHTCARRSSLSHACAQEKLLFSLFGYKRGSEAPFFCGVSSQEGSQVTRSKKNSCETPLTEYLEQSDL